MDNNILYKGLKYTFVWGVVYLIIQSVDKTIKPIDIALLASVFTLMVCMCDSVCSTLDIAVNAEPEHYMNNQQFEDAIQIKDILAKQVIEQPIIKEEYKEYKEYKESIQPTAKQIAEYLKSQAVKQSDDQKDKALGDRSSDDQSDVHSDVNSDVNSDVHSDVHSDNQSDVQSDDNSNDHSDDHDTDLKQPDKQPETKKDFDEKIKDCKNGTCTVSPDKKLEWYEQKIHPRMYEGAENLDQIAVCGGKTRNNLLVNEMIYSDFNRLPPSLGKKDFEYGYSFLPPKDWYPIPVYPPVCVSNSTCQVQPVYTDTMTMDLKEWNYSQKISGYDTINTEYIINELNSKG